MSSTANSKAFLRRKARSALHKSLALVLVLSLSASLSHFSAAQDKERDFALSADESPPPRSSGPEQRADVPHLADYKIVAHLNVEQQTLSAEQVISFHNISNQPLKELYFHLYYNAFENEETLFQREGQSRSGSTLLTPGSIQIDRLTIDQWGAKNLWQDAAPHSPGDPKDRTDIRLPLPEPIAPGQVLQIRLSFSLQIPSGVERTGYVDDFYLLGQWFPKLARLKEDGTWVHFPFHAQAEFHANFADYRVEMDVPTGFKVGATGALRSLASSVPGRRRYEARAREVIDFAWTAWDQFEEETRVFGGVNVRLLAPPRTTKLRKDILSTIEKGLPFLGKQLGPYPYPQLTVVMPPPKAQSIAGMEYPQFITTTGRGLTPYLGLRVAELVAFHELAHQWFQTTIATDEYHDPLLDEGFTAYKEWLFLDQKGPEHGVLSWPGLTLSRQAVSRYSYFRWETAGWIKHPPTSAASEFSSFGELAQVIYSRTPLCLLTLAGAFGPKKLERAFRTYAQRYRFKHPSLSDFYAVLEEQLGPHALKQAKLMLEDNENLDLAVESVSTHSGDGRNYHTRLVVSHEGQLELPYEVVVRLRDGTMQTQQGSSRGKQAVYEFDHQEKLDEVALDPDARIALDPNYLNNRSTVLQSKQPISRIETALFSWVSWLLQLGGG